MTGEQLRKIDVLIARRVFKAEVLDATFCTKDGNDPWIFALGQGREFFGEVPRYSSDKSVVYKVVDKLFEDGYDISILSHGPEWLCKIEGDFGITIKTHKSFSLVICLAALQAFEVDLEKELAA